MALPRQLALAATTLLLVALCVSASAEVVAHKKTYITGDTTIGSITCDAVVDRALDGTYKYDYQLTYTTGTSAVHTFEIQNPNWAGFFGSSNTPTEVGKFDNPADGNANWLVWINGELPVHGTRTFSYLSRYAPQDIVVWTFVIDGGGSASGQTIGMGDTIPEPSSLAALLLGGAGLIPLIIRRRKA